MHRLTVNSEKEAYAYCDNCTCNCVHPFYKKVLYSTLGIAFKINLCCMAQKAEGHSVAHVQTRIDFPPTQTLFSNHPALRQEWYMKLVKEKSIPIVTKPEGVLGGAK